MEKKSSKVKFIFYIISHILAGILFVYFILQGLILQGHANNIAIQIATSYESTIYQQMYNELQFMHAGLEFMKAIFFAVLFEIIALHFKQNQELR